MGKAIQYLIFGLAGAALAMFAEPFFFALFALAGIDSGQWAKPVLDFMATLSGQRWFQLLTIALVAFAAGAAVVEIMRKSELKSSQALRKLAYDLTEVSRVLESLRTRLDGRRELPRYEEMQRYANMVFALEISLSRLGIPTPKISFEADPIGYLERMRDYLSRIAPLIAMSHLKEARTEASAIVAQLDMEAPRLMDRSPS